MTPDQLPARAETNTRPPVQIVNGQLAPQSFEEMFRISTMLAQSKLVPSEFRGKPAEIMVAVQMGAEIGLSPVQSLRNIAVINGRPSVWGDALVALVLKSPVCEYVRASVDTSDPDNPVGWCESKRRGCEATRTTFSKQDAIRAGLWGRKGPWKQYPKRMLLSRARGFELRDNFADALGGLITREEAEDYPAPTSTFEDRLETQHAQYIEAPTVEEELTDEAPALEADVAQEAPVAEFPPADEVFPDPPTDGTSADLFGGQS